ncbi:hypothetical protein RISK_000472 [Rhodopirellula islandica]|uniref:Uncharacterized protein n=1 Tax=Rhodopirellula islandica TaxID=595434 RepID=A0A0J1EPL0_RHOIS|nr:hypothetical protein RISK_000472 [Rhodopirellula islandica]
MDRRRRIDQANGRGVGTQGGDGECVAVGEIFISLKKRMPSETPVSREDRHWSGDCNCRTFHLGPFPLLLPRS